MARCGCTGGCTCAVGADPACPLVSVTGDGSALTPYLICVELTPSADADNALVEGTDGLPYVPDQIDHAETHLPGGGDELWLPHRQRATESAPYPYERASVDSSALTDQVTAFTYFEAQLDLLATKFRVVSGATGATTLTSTRLGLYTVDGSNALTLVAQSAAADAATLLTANTMYEPVIANDGGGGALASYQMTRGVLYAIGIFQDAATPATVRCYNGGVATAVNRIVKRATVRSATDAGLPASVLSAAQTDSAVARWAAMAS